MITPNILEPIPYETGFPTDNDFASLKEKGQKLSNALNKLTQPTVIAVDGSWGSGKSYFLKCWSTDHNMDAKVIYFDAFKHDYLDEPLISLSHEISNRIKSPKWKKAVKAATKLALPMSKLGLGIMTLGATNVLNEVGDKIVEISADELENAADAYWSVEKGRKAAMEEFIETLKTMTSPDSDTKPQRLILIIDELDRCRPDYALQMMEIIKHFFSVPNVHFVLGVNLKELENSVRARYGTQVDAAKYLQRFIAVTMPIRRRPFSHRPVGSELEQHYFKNLFDNVGAYSDEFYGVNRYLEVIPDHEKLTYRDMERLYTLCMTVGMHPRGNAYGELTSGLLIIKACRPNWIQEIINGTIDPDLISCFFQLDSETVWSSRQSRGYVSENSNIFWKAALYKSAAEQLPENLKQFFSSIHLPSNHPFPLLAEICATHLDSFNLR